MLHALSSRPITRGDDGRREINYSNIGGNLASGAIANAYSACAGHNDHNVIIRYDAHWQSL